MDSVYKFNSQLEARDKVFRLVQYGTRLLWSLKQGAGGGGGQVDELKKIESAISFSRQMLRFGKFLESLNAALRSVHLQDAFLRTTLSLAQIADGLYLLCDHLVWLSKLGVIKLANEERFAVMGDSYWLYSTLLLLAKHLYQMQIIWANAPLRSFDSVAYQHHQQRSTKSSSSGVDAASSSDGGGGYSEYLRRRTAATARQLLHFALVNRSLTLEVLKNLCDAVISMNASRKVAFSPFTVGFVGTVSSLIPLLKYRTMGSIC